MGNLYKFYIFIHEAGWFFTKLTKVMNFSYLKSF